MVLPADIVNRAIQIFGDNQPLVTGAPPTFDNSTTGIAAGALYNGVVGTVAREFGWDFSRNMVALVLTGNVAPFPFTYEYAYPTNGIQVRQVSPAALADMNNPLPVNYTVGNTLVGLVQTKVIWANFTPARAAFTNQPSESLWDPLFTESVVRMLSSELAMALAGRPDFSRELLEGAQAFEKMGEGRQD